MRTESAWPHVILPAGLLATALLLAGAAHAGAQVPVRTFQDLGARVKVGDTVYITDSTGPAEQEARILELTSSLLAASIGGVRRDFGEGNVSRIRKRMPDSRKNGAVSGFLIGAAASTAGAVITASPSGNCKADCIAISALIGGGWGTLGGWVIDSLIQSRRDIYLRGEGRQSRRVQVRPFASSHARGLGVSFGF